MRRSNAATLAIAACLGLTLSACNLVGERADDASTTQAAGPLDSETCKIASGSSASHSPDTTKIAEGTVTLAGHPFTFAGGTWDQEHPTNPAATLAYHSLGWAVPETRDGIPEAIDLVAAYHRENPDPGSSKATRVNGWVEAPVTLRTRTILCLWRNTDDTGKAKLKDALSSITTALLDEERYYGPPNHRPHNHGVMADRELLNIAEATGNNELASTAEKRLLSQISGGMYDECGFQYEQSSGYQYFHRDLWTSLSKRLPEGKLNDQIKSKVELVAKAALSITYPSAATPAIGDGAPGVEGNPGLLLADIGLNCPKTGWYTQRKTRDGKTQHWIIRYGPATDKHGHEDKGEVLWWVGEGNRGYQVLADRGLPGKNQDLNYYYAIGSTAHPVLSWDGGNSAASTLSVAKTDPDGKRSVVLTMKTSKGTWTRTVRSSENAYTLVIEDRVSGPAASKEATSNLPLDPSWLAQNSGGQYATGEGYSLTITCKDSTGKAIPVVNVDTLDFQIPQAREAYTPTCTTRAGNGITATLTITKTP